VIWTGAALAATPFLDLSAQVSCCGERGLLGFAFHPDYASNGVFFVDYTDLAGDTVLARFQVSGDDADLADPGSEEVLLTVDQPFANHNGGHLAFGPDGYLYVASGDGGSGGDPQERAQDRASLLGKLLRLDVDAPPADPLAYAIPAGNPFTGVSGVREEIWAWGLRNPWRFSFDRATGDLWTGDVGQVTWEEVDLQPAASGGGENYGWDCREGAHDYVSVPSDPGSHCPVDDPVDPVLEYVHAAGRCSVTGGFRYRGDGEPRLRGVYLYGDFCSGEIFGTVPRCDGVWEGRVLLDAPFNITTFGEDATGELYVSEYVGDPENDPLSRVHRLGLAVGSGGPDLEAPGTLDFGTVEVGDTVALPLALANVNPGPEAVMVASTVLSDPARFTARGGDTPGRCPSRRPCVPPGAGCDLEVRFQSGAPGAVAESLEAQGNFVAETVLLTAQVVPCTSAVDLEVTGLTVTGGAAETRRACDTLTAGPDVAVEAGGALTLRAGTRIVLRGGFRVAAGGALTLEIF
jgi:adhesin HecA-like repeat protein